jgi:hypothetical protein
MAGGVGEGAPQAGDSKQVLLTLLFLLDVSAGEQMEWFSQRSAVAWFRAQPPSPYPDRAPVPTPALMLCVTVGSGSSCCPLRPQPVRALSSSLSCWRGM